MQFLKMHGAGNDFVVIDNVRGDLAATDWTSLARAMCDRHFGIGSDGILVAERSAIAPFRMRMFNPDGSESEMCGNGIRCFGKYLYDRGLTDATRVAVETGAGVLTLDLHVRDGAVSSVTVDMGVPEFRPDRVPVIADGEFARDCPVEGVGAAVRVSCVSMGNPHAVMFIDQPVVEYALAEVGPRVERHAMFPRRVNFEIVRQVSPTELEARVWERGAGLTLACGTGACAIAAVARRHGRIGDDVTVRLPGGALDIHWDGRGAILMTGPAVLVFEGVWRGTN
ncbi:MAG: diaminopimelate epimerase [Chloroflexota bacterium]|nr:MAG: diaminopimelate epimerase [Chloroflexota bacterium]